MNYRCKHVSSGLSFNIQNDGHMTLLNGDETLVLACREYLDSFKNSYHIKSDVQQMKNLYGDLVIQTGSVFSVDTDNPEFITKYLIPELTAMGYSCTKE